MENNMKRYISHPKHRNMLPVDDTIDIIEGKSGLLFNISGSLHLNDHYQLPCFPSEEKLVAIILEDCEMNTPRISAIYDWLSQIVLYDDHKKDIPVYRKINSMEIIKLGILKGTLVTSCSTSLNEKEDKYYVKAIFSYDEFEPYQLLEEEHHE